MIALKEGHIEIAKILLEEKNLGHQKQVRHLLEERDNDKKNVLHYCFGSRKPTEVAQFLLDVCLSNYQESSSTKLKEFLTMKDSNGDTPFHILVQRELGKDTFDNLFKILKNTVGPSEEHVRNALIEHSSEDKDEPSQMEMETSEILECMKERNLMRETPLHTAANKGQASFIESLLDLNLRYGSIVDHSLEDLLEEKDEDGNTAFHLATQKANHGKTKEVTKVLLDYIRDHTKDQMKYLTMKNSFGWTPFSGAVAEGDQEMVEDMLQGLGETEKRAVVNEPDFKNAFPLHLAAKYGHVGIFNTLLKNGFAVTERGGNEQTALDIAIEHEQRAIIRAIIQGSDWEKAFQIPSTSDKGELDTPLRKLIQKMPDLAEEFLDRCVSLDNKKKVIKMNADFIEDTHKYILQKHKSKDNNRFRYKGSSCIQHTLAYHEEEYKVDINNHPMVLMDETKCDLLSHPLSIAIIMRKWSLYRGYYFFTLGFYLTFLIFLSLYAMTSPSPIFNPELANCCNYPFDNPEFFNCPTSQVTLSSQKYQRLIGKNSDLNNFTRWVSIVLIAVRVLIFLGVKEYKPIWNQLKDVEFKKGLGEFWISAINFIPWLFLADFLVYSLALYITIHNFSSVSKDGNIFFDTDVRTCAQQQVSAITLILAGLNLLVYMRMLPLGKYIILFQAVIMTFVGCFIVGFVIVAAFTGGFYMILSHKEDFQSWLHSLFKTVTMLAGEFNYGDDIFYKELPPEGFGSEDWDKGYESPPFPFLTYVIFLVYFFLGPIVALNVLVGLIVDASSQNFVEIADLRMMSMRLHYILAAERGRTKYLLKRFLPKSPFLKKLFLDVSDDKENPSFEIQKHHKWAKIWEKYETRQGERRRKSELKAESQIQKKLMFDQHKKTREMLGLKLTWPRFTSRYGRQTSSFDCKDDEIFKLTKKVKDMLNYMRNPPMLQEANLEIERLASENRYLKEIQLQSAVEIKRLNTEIKHLSGMRSDLNTIIQHLSSKEPVQGGNSQNSASIII